MARRGRLPDSIINVLERMGGATINDLICAIPWDVDRSEISSALHKLRASGRASVRCYVDRHCLSGRKSVAFWVSHGVRKK